MKFVLKKLTIWFGEGIEPQILEFEPNKVNVITGDSGSGKTNILAIIDYCFLSSRNNIVEQVINENADWYSIEFIVNNTSYFLGRSKANLGQESADVCFMENYIPNYPYSNTKISNLKTTLNSLMGIDDQFPLNKVKGVNSFEISFRTFLVFNYLTERIISLDNVYFDFEYFEKALFENNRTYIIERGIGYDDAKRLSYFEELTLLKKNKSEFDKKSNSFNSKKIKIQEQSSKIIEKAIENNIIDNYLQLEDEVLIEYINTAVQNYMSLAKLESSNSKVIELKDELKKLTLENRNIDRAEKEILEYESNLGKFEDALRPIEIIGLQADNIVRSFETTQLVDALQLSLLSIRNARKPNSKGALISPLDKERIRKRVDEINIRLKDFAPANTNLLNKSTYAFIVARELMSDLENLQKEIAKNVNPIDSSLDNYVQKVSQLEDLIKLEEQSIPSLLSSLNKEIQHYYNQLNYMGNYSDCDISFNIDEFIVQLRQKSAHYPYGKIGSKSNDMFLHLCLFLGLQSHFRKMQNSYILPFLFIDQPSIPYYSGSDEIENDDRAKLTDAFILLNNFIANYEDDFQIIMIEHAPESYWKDNNLEYFHTVAVFTNGNKLIPQRILKQN
jgi:energy-coupling factor transporter ATP-binding protein EcfA2